MSDTEDYPTAGAVATLDDEIIPKRRSEEFSLGEQPVARLREIDYSRLGNLDTEATCRKSSCSEQTSWFGQYCEDKMAQWLVNQNRVTLAKTCHFHQLKDHLIQYDVLERGDVKTIELEKTETQRMSRLLDIVSEKPKEKIQRFFAVLNEGRPEAYDQCVWPQPPLPFPDSSLTPNLSMIQEELESWYLSTLSKLRPIPWIPFYEMEMDHVYTNLEIISSYKHSLSKRGGQTTATGLTEVEAPTTSNSRRGNSVIGTVEQLADKLWGGANRTVTFIEGPPGIGKSTLCRRLAYTWAKSSHNIHGFSFKLVIFLEARAMQSDFKRCIYQQLFPEDFDLNERDVYKCVQESQKDCLVIIDGIDELNDRSKSELLELLQGRILRKSHVLLTGRPEVSPDYLRFCDNHLRITGFNKKNRDSYIYKYFTSDQCVPRDKLLQQISKNKYLQDLTVNPFITLLLCILVEEGGGEIPINLHDMVTEITRTVFRRYISSDIHGQGTPPDIDELLKASRYLAFIGIQSDKLVFEESFLQGHFPTDLCEHLLKSGILNRDCTVSRIHTKGYCYFPHKTIQELLCCEYLTDLTEKSFIGHWNSFKSRFSSFMKTCLLNLIGNQPGKFRLVLADIIKANVFNFPSITRELTDVQSQNLLVDYIIQMHGYKVDRLLLEWLTPISTQNAYILRVLCHKMTLPTVVLITSGYSFRRGAVGFRIAVVDYELFVPYTRDFGILAFSDDLSSGCLKNTGVILPVVNCTRTSLAGRLLRDHVDIGVLAIFECVTTARDFQDVCEFIKALEGEDRPMTVYLLILSHFEADCMLMKLLALVGSTTCKNTRLHVSVNPWLSNSYKCECTIFIHKPIPGLEWASPPMNATKTRLRYEMKPLPAPHRMYFEKHCPY